MQVCVFLIVTLVGLGTLSGSAQTIKWSPPDKSFTVDVPVKLTEFKDYGVFGSYGAITEKYTIITMILKNPKYPTMSIDDKFGGLWFVLGGDDDHEFTEQYIKVDGLTAQEIVYKNQPTKGVFIDAGDTVYVLGIHVEKQKDLDSSIAKQFFSSFRLTHPVKQKTDKKPVTKSPDHP